MILMIRSRLRLTSRLFNKLKGKLRMEAYTLPFHFCSLKSSIYKTVIILYILHLYTYSYTRYV